MKNDTELRLTYDIKRNSWDDDPKSAMFIARVVYMGDDNTPRNAMDSDWDLAQYANLGITAHTSLEYGWYGFEVHYIEPYRVSLRQAERQVKLLRKIQKALDRFDNEFGSTSDLPTFCARVTQALGCKTAQRYGHFETEMTTNGTRYRWTDVDGLRSALDKFVSQQDA